MDWAAPNIEPPEAGAELGAPKPPKTEAVEVDAGVEPPPKVAGVEPKTELPEAPNPEDDEPKSEPDAEGSVSAAGADPNRDVA